MSTIDRTVKLTIPGIAELYEIYLAKSYKSLIAIATDPDREPVYMDIVEMQSCEDMKEQHSSQHGTDHEPRAVEPPQTSHAAQ